MMPVIRISALLALLIFVIGCSGSGSTTQGPIDTTPDNAPVDLTGTETFDSSAYPIESPSISGAVDHDVPAELMTGDLGDNKTLRTVSGFRIQIHSSLDKNEAVEKETQANTWWGTIAPDERPAGLGSSELAMYLHFQSPYYRVRIGNFGKRSDADDALGIVQESFPSAFIVVDTVTIYR